MNAVSLIGLTIMVSLLSGGFGSVKALAQQSAPATQSMEKLPADIHPDSLSRIPRAKREDLTTEEERQAFDRLVGANAISQTGPLGPTGTRLHFPIAAELYRNAVRWIRENAGLEPRFVELAILVATRETNGQYEWLAHEPSALEAGLLQETIDIVKFKRDTKELGEKEQVLIRFGREMSREPKVSSKTFADMERLFGRKGTLAVTMLIAHYSTSSILLHTYDQHLRPEQKPPFP